MPLSFHRSLIGTAGSQSAAAQAAAFSISNTSFSGTRKVGSHSLLTTLSGSNINSSGSVTVYPKNGSFYLNKNHAWTIEFWLANNSNGAPSSSYPGEIFRLEGSLRVGTGIFSSGGPRIIQYSDGVPKFRVFGDAYVGDFNYSSTVTWLHMALSSTGTGQYKWWIDGSNYSTWNTSDSTSRRDFYIGQRADSVGNTSRIHIDELRVSDSQRYTSGFTPGTTAFTTDENTLALFHLDNNFTDSSV